MGDLKPGWKRVALGDVADVITDYWDRDSSRPERFVAGEHIDEGALRVSRWGMTDDELVPPTFNRRFKAGDVLFHSRNIRKLAQPDFGGITGEKIFVLRTRDPQVLMQGLLPFLLQITAFSDYTERMWAGSTNKFLNKAPLVKYEFALPPMEEQMRITQLLEAIRATVEYCQRSKNEADTVISAFVENRLHSLRSSFSEASAVDLLDRLTVGIVVRPSDWYTSDGSGVPALRSLNVRPGELNFNDLVRISSDGHAAHEKSQLLPGDVVVVRTGRPGEAAVVPEEIGLLNCIDLIVTTPGKNLNSHFFALFLNSATGRRSFSAGAAGTAQQHFNVGAFKHIRLPLPPIDMQVETVSKVEVFASARSALEDRIAGLKMLMQSALQDGVIQ